MPATKKKSAATQILNVGDRLRVVHPHFNCEVTCEVLDVIDPVNNLRVPGQKGRVVAWAEVVTDSRPAWRRRRAPLDRVAVIEGRWRRVRRAKTEAVEVTVTPRAPEVPSLPMHFAPRRAYELGLPAALVSRLTREIELDSDNERADEPLVALSGNVAAIGEDRSGVRAFVEEKVARSFVTRLLRCTNSALDELFSHVFDVMSVLTQYADPATGVKKVLADLSPRLVVDYTPEGFRAATWIERRLPTFWTTPVICHFWLTCSDDTRRDAIAQYRGKAEALKMVPIPTPPENERE